jgi:hypothetical protein
MKDLRERFVNGDKKTVRELVEDYFAPKTPYAYLVAEKIMRSLLRGIKTWFRKNHGLWFGNLDDNGNYGLIDTEAEARFAMIRYFRFVRGTVMGAHVLTENARAKGLLPKGVITENFLVATIGEEQKKKSGN